MSNLFTPTRLLLLAATLGFGMTTADAEENDKAWAPDFGVELTTELQGTTDRRCNLAYLLHLQANLPLGKGLSVDLSTISTCMTSEESIGGDLQTFSNLDAGNLPLALAVGGLRWDINERHTLFAGVRNTNEDYFVSPVTTLFTNSSCGIYPTISSNFAIANYPVASVGVHYKYERTFGTSPADDVTEAASALIFQASLYNGTGYNGFAGRDNVFRVCPKDDGVFALTDIAFNHRGSSYYLGGCGRYGTYADGSQEKFGGALWTYAEQRLTSSLSLIAGLSHAFVSTADCSDFVGVGGKYEWRRCEFGLFTDYARFDTGAESATELTCNVALTPYISLQPTIHLIASPLEEPHDNHTLRAMGTLRLKIAF